MLPLLLRSASAWRQALSQPGAHASAAAQHACLRCSGSAAQATLPSRGTHWLRYGVAGVAALGAATYLSGTEQFKVAYLIPTRLFRDVWTAAAIVADYKTSLHDGLQGEERAQELAACHQRGADRLLQLCFANGGIYTKLGQHLGQLDHLLPDAYVLTMRNNLLDRCPVSSYKEVRSTIIHDLGAPPEKLFAYFNPNPIASASLAQVHVAEDLEGRKVAVKVQHAGLRESSTADIATVAALVQLVKLVFPDFDYQWLVDEIRHNLPCELDFLNEARNAERCRENLNAKRSILKDRVHIPTIYHDKCSQRVITMEYVEGVPVTDIPGLRKQRISTGKLSRLISETFSEMIFFHGFVHADPHAANMLVRKQRGQMQLVLLDHGLYREIDDAFRLTYAELWKALVFADVEGIKKCAQAMNAGDMVPLFAGMLTQRPWEDVINQDVDHLTVGTTQEHRAKLQGYVQQYSREIAQMLLRMPRELLLLLKTNDCLRSVDTALGQPVNNIIVTARECTRALAEQHLSSTPAGPARWVARARAQLMVLHVELVLAGLRAITWVSWARSLVGLPPINTRQPLLLDA